MQITTKIVCAVTILFFSIFPISSYAQYADDVGYDAYYDTYPSPEYYAEPAPQNTYYTYQVVDEPEYYQPRKKYRNKSTRRSSGSSYSSRLPSDIGAPGEKVIIVDPRKHVWGAYASNGKLIRAGLATAGANWCEDIGRSCRTRSGTFRIKSLGSRSCKSTKYPIEEGGGAPMPYCMYFNGNQGIHGSNGVAEANLSHGCVRVSVSDAEWLRFNFANVGTKVIVKPY